METLGGRLTRLRKAEGMRQQDLADALKGYGLVADRVTISRWETDKQEPTVAPIMAMSKIFGVTAEYLVNGLTTDFVSIKPNEQEIIKAIRQNPNLAKVIECAKDMTQEQIELACRLVCSIIKQENRAG